jgi:hypothetical protein
MRVWLPKVLQNLTPWASSQDIAKGARWAGEITNHLRDSQFGLICVTPENQREPWLLFEAGALSNALGTELVTPFLLGLEPSALRPPLSQFQATMVVADDVRKLLRTLNARLSERPLPETQVDEAFDVWWPKLDSELKAIEPQAVEPPPRTERELIEETLNIARVMGRILGVGQPAWGDPLRENLRNLLTPREEKVLRMRLGIGERTNYTLEQVAEAFEASPEQIQRIERKALRTLLEAEALRGQDEPAG